MVAKATSLTIRRRGCSICAAGQSSLCHMKGVVHPLPFQLRAYSTKMVPGSNFSRLLVSFCGAFNPSPPLPPPSVAGIIPHAPS